MQKLTDVLTWIWANKAQLLTYVAAVIAAASVLVKAAEKLAGFLATKWPDAFKGVDDELVGLAAWLDALASSGFFNALAVNPKKAKAAAKAAVVVLALGLFLPSTARAQGFDWSVGPTLPFLAYELGGSATPVQVAPGAGLQVSVTHDALKVDLGGKAWDAVDLTGMAFGTLVTPASGQQFGELSAAVAVGFLSNLISVGVGKHLLAPDSALVHGGYFVVLALNFNFAVAPTAPSGNALFDKASWHLPRGNTLYLVGGP